MDEGGAYGTYRIYPHSDANCNRREHSNTEITIFKSNTYRNYVFVTGGFHKK